MYSHAQTYPTLRARRHPVSHSRRVRTSRPRRSRRAPFLRATTQQVQSEPKLRAELFRFGLALGNVAVWVGLGYLLAS
jgi:hypothetical protein